MKDEGMKAVVKMLSENLTFERKKMEASRLLINEISSANVQFRALNMMLEEKNANLNERLKDYDRLQAEVDRLTRVVKALDGEISRSMRSTSPGDANCQ